MNTKRQVGTSEARAIDDGLNVDEPNVLDSRRLSMVFDKPHRSARTTAVSALDEPTIDELMDDWAATTSLLATGSHCLESGDTVDGERDDRTEELIAPELLFPDDM